MADMFGGPVGTQAFNADMRGAVSAQEALGRIAMQPAQQRQYEAHARLFEAQAVEKEQEAKAQAEMARLLMEPGQGGTAESAATSFSMADQFDRVAGIAAKSGNIKTAQEAAKTAAELRTKEAQQLSAETTARVNQIKIIKERSQLLGQLFGGAQNEADWNRANALFTFQTGQQSPYAGVAYNPELVGSINTQALETKEALELKEKELTRRALKDYRDSRLGQHEATRAISAERLKLEREREERLKKTGGGKGAAGAPSAEEVSQVKALMRLDGIDVSSFTSDKEGASLKSTAFAIGSRAREMQQENRALGRAQALQRAYQEAKDNGELDIVKSGGTDVPLVGRVGGDKRLGSGLPPAARKALKEGQEVTFRNGQVWTLDNGQPKRVR